jgi:hypothetical protein
VPYPENAGYMIAAYIVVAVLVLGYAVSLWVRLREASRQ